MITNTFFRKIRSGSISLIFTAALFATSCQKEVSEGPTLDYALQVIPDIHDVMPIDLIKAMDSIPVNTTTNGQNTVVYVSALHFGDNPPNLFKMAVDTSENHNDMLLLGFAAGSVEVRGYIQSDTTKEYVLEPGLIRPYTNYFHFHDQHRGVAKFDFRCSYIDLGEDDYIFETTHVGDSVFIMGEGNHFTAYFRQKRTKEYCPKYNPDDPGERDAVILSGEVTPNGIRDLYFGIRVTGYDNPADAGTIYPYINDIVIFYKSFLPFTYWDPYAYTNNN